tara:strand:+ start:128 stop:544 length:417 start_codon:yes stop_codon:yes gene_type:complete
MASSHYEKYLYFRTQADEDDDDGGDDSAMFPLSSLTGIHVTAAAAITLFFKPVIRTPHDEGANAFTNNDSVVLNVTEGTAFEVQRDLVQHFNGGPHNDGFLVVADDMTTLLDNSTRSAVYLVPNITSCGAIAIGAAHA